MNSSLFSILKLRCAVVVVVEHSRRRKIKLFVMILCLAAAAYSREQTNAKYSSRYPYGGRLLLTGVLYIHYSILSHDFHNTTSGSRLTNFRANFPADFFFFRVCLMFEHTDTYAFLGRIKRRAKKCATKWINGGPTANRSMQNNNTNLWYREEGMEGMGCRERGIAKSERQLQRQSVCDGAMITLHLRIVHEKHGWKREQKG